MAHPNTRVPTDKTVERDFQAGTVQPGPGMAPAQPPAEDMKDPGASEEVPGACGTPEKQGQSAQQQKSSHGCCGCG